MAEEVKLSLSVEGRREVERELSRVDRAVDEVGRGLKDLDGDAGHAERSLRDLSRDGDRSMRSLSSDVDRATSAVGRDLRGVGTDTDRASRDLRELANDASRSASEINGAFGDISLGGLSDPLVQGAAGAAGIVGAIASALGAGDLIGAATAPLSEPLSFEGDIASAAARVGVSEQDVLSLVQPLEELRGRFDRGELAEGFVAVAENLRTFMRSDAESVETIDRLLALQETGIGDASEIAQAAGNLAGAFGENDINRVLDLMAASVQQGGDRTGDLVDTLREYAAQAAEFGLTLDDFLGQLVAASDPTLGQFNLDKVGDAIKELGNRLSTGGDAVTDALDEIGVSREALTSALAEGGEDGRLAFQGLLDAINEVESAAARNRITEEVFGAPAEDFTQLVEVLDLTEERLGNVDLAAQRLSDTLNDTTLGDITGASRYVRNTLFGSAGSSDPFGFDQRLGNSLLSVLPASRSGFSGPVRTGASGIGGVIPANVRNEVNLNVDVQVRGGLIDSVATQRNLAAALAPHITREVDRQVRRSSVFGGRTEGTQ